MPNEQRHFDAERDPVSQRLLECDVYLLARALDIAPGASGFTSATVTIPPDFPKALCKPRSSRDRRLRTVRARRSGGRLRRRCARRPRSSFSWRRRSKYRSLLVRPLPVRRGVRSDRAARDGRADGLATRDAGPNMTRTAETPVTDRSARRGARDRLAVRVRQRRDRCARARSRARDRGGAPAAASDPQARRELVARWLAFNIVTVGKLADASSIR